MAANAEHDTLVRCQCTLGGDDCAAIVAPCVEVVQLAVLEAKLTRDVAVVLGGGGRVDAASVLAALLTHQHVGADDVDAERVAQTAYRAVVFVVIGRVAVLHGAAVNVLVHPLKNVCVMYVHHANSLCLD